MEVPTAPGDTDVEFNKYLAESGAHSAILKLLVGFAESASQTAESGDAPDWNEFTSEALTSPPLRQLPDFVRGEVSEDARAIMAENDELKTRAAELEAQLEAERARLSQLRTAAPQLTLRLSGIRATGFPVLGLDEGSKGEEQKKTDPFIRFQIGEARVDLPPVPNDAEPSWEEPTDLVIPAADLPKPLFPMRLRVALLDNDVTNADDFIGETSVAIADDNGSVEARLVCGADEGVIPTVSFSWDLTA